MCACVCAKAQKRKLSKLENHWRSFALKLNKICARKCGKAKRRNESEKQKQANEI